MQRTVCSPGANSAPCFTCAVDALTVSPIGSARPPRHDPRKFSAIALKAMLFTGRAKPWPSSGNTTYVTGMFFAAIACTIWSDSRTLTRGSFAPCPIRSGRTMRSAANSGERSFSSARPASVSGSPMRLWNCCFTASQ